jgi:hypothetical protein
VETRDAARSTSPRWPIGAAIGWQPFHCTLDLPSYESPKKNLQPGVSKGVYSLQLSRLHGMSACFRK